MVAYPISSNQGAVLVAEIAVFYVAVFAVFYLTANSLANSSRMPSLEHARPIHFVRKRKIIPTLQPGWG